jgi:hypothetical protein
VERRRKTRKRTRPKLLKKLPLKWRPLLLLYQLKRMPRKLHPSL